MQKAYLLLMLTINCSCRDAMLRVSLGIGDATHCVSTQKFTNLTNGYYLKNQVVEDDFTTKGLRKAKKVLDKHELSIEEQRAYDRAVDACRHNASVLETSLGTKDVGISIGIKEGMAQGKVEAKKEIVIKLLEKGFNISNISEIIALPENEIKSITINNQ